MPRYYFDIVDRDGTHIDDTGIDCQDLEAAMALARRTMSDLARDAFRDADRADLLIRLRDDMDGPVVLRVTLETLAGKDEPGQP